MGKVVPLSAFPRLRFSRQAVQQLATAVLTESSSTSRERCGVAGTVAGCLPVGQQVFTTADVKDMLPVQLAAALHS